MGKLDSLFDEVEKQGSIDALFDDIEANPSPGSSFGGMGDVKAAEFQAGQPSMSRMSQFLRGMAPGTMRTIEAPQPPAQPQRPVNTSRMPSSFADFAPAGKLPDQLGPAIGDALSLPSRAVAKVRGQDMSDPGSFLLRPEAEQAAQNVESQNAANPWNGRAPGSFADFGRNAMPGAADVILQAASDPLSYGNLPIKAGQKLTNTVTRAIPESLGKGLEAAGQSQMRKVIKPLMRHERQAAKPIEETIFEYGLDKGKGGASPKAIYDRSSQKLNQLGAQLKQRIVQGKDQGIRVNTDKIINDVVNEFKAAPGETENFFQIAPDVEDIAKDFKARARLANAKGFGDLDLFQAQNFKRYMGHEGAWEQIAKAKGIPVKPNESARSQIAEAVYHRLNDAIDELAPEGIRDLNRQISEIIPVHQNAGWRQVVEGRNNAISLSDVVGMTATAVNPKVWPILVVNRMSKSGTVASKIYRIGEKLRNAKTPAEQTRYAQALRKLGLDDQEIAASMQIVESSGGKGAFDAQDLRVTQPPKMPPNSGQSPAGPANPTANPSNPIQPVPVVTNSSSQPGGLEWQVAGVRRRQAERYLQATLKRAPEPKEVQDFLASYSDKDIPKPPEREIVSREFKGRRTGRELNGMENLLRNGDPEWATTKVPVNKAPDTFSIGGMELKRTKGQWDNQIIYKDKQGKTYTFRGDETIHMDSPKAPETPKPMEQQDAPKDDFIGDDGQPLFQMRDAEKLFSQKGQIVRRDGKSSITLFKDRADVSTLMHEHAHWLRTNAIDDATQSKVLKSFGSESWDRAAEEKFARGFERYLYNGTAPHESLNPAFTKMKSRFREIYKDIKGTELEADIPEEMRILYDAVLLRGVKPTPKTQKIINAMKKATGNQKVKLIAALRTSLNQENQK